ncbi:Hypothetical protein FKW44_025335, partial [Caligus rogercresseyi]
GQRSTGPLNTLRSQARFRKVQVQKNCEDTCCEVEDQGETQDKSNSIHETNGLRGVHGHHQHVEIGQERPEDCSLIREATSDLSQRPYEQASSPWKDIIQQLSQDRSSSVL